MKIHYNPAYDGDLFFNTETDLMGVQYVGNKGLLDTLQLRTGLHKELESDVERETKYMLAAKKCAEGSFIKSHLK